MREKLVSEENVAHRRRNGGGGETETVEVMSMTYTILARAPLHARQQTIAQHASFNNLAPCQPCGRIGTEVPMKGDGLWDGIRPRLGLSSCRRTDALKPARSAIHFLYIYFCKKR